MKLTAITGQDLDARLVGLEQCPAYWRARAQVRFDEARAYSHTEPSFSSKQMAIANLYLDIAMRCAK